MSNESDSNESDTSSEIPSASTLSEEQHIEQLETERMSNEIDSNESDTSSEILSASTLSEEQRIEQLEKAGKLNRLLIYALAAALVLSLLAGLMMSLLRVAPEEHEPAASQASVQALQKELGALQLQTETLQQQLQNQQKLIVMIQQQKPVSAPPAPKVKANNSDKETVLMVTRTLIGQERNYQESLKALNIGMRDLAKMIAGSRSWLAFYQESLAKPMADSQARVKALQKWSQHSGRTTP